MTLPKSLTTVTTISKLFALWLYLFLPFAGFYLGMGYQSNMNTHITKDLTQPIAATSNTITEIPFISPFPVVTDDWNTFRDTTLNITFKYPKDWKIDALTNNSISIIKTVLLDEGPPLDKQNYTNRIIISKTTVGESVTLHQWLEQTLGQDKNLYSLVLESVQKTSLGEIYKGGMEALSVEIPGAAAYHTKATVGIKNNVGYQITTRGMHFKSGIEETYQGIIGTFSLINSNVYPTLSPNTTSPPIVESNPNKTVCLQDAKMCPDGSFVNRTGSNCEFAPCQKMEP